MIINMTGGSGGGSGASLTVNSANAGTVTVSNSTLGKSYSKTVTAGGSVVFKGLATGTWTVTLSASGQTPSTKTVNITADYATSIAFFTASIVITYPANSSLTVKDSGGNTVATDTNATATTKTYTATVSAAGTYTITATATDGSGNSTSGTAVISSDGQSVSVTLSYWNGELYDNGNEYEAYTGGWSVGTNGGFGASAKKTDVDMWIGSSATNATAISYAETNEEVDATGYSKLNVKVSEAVGPSHKIYFGEAAVGTFGAAASETTWTTNLGSAKKGIVSIENTGYSGGSSSITIIKVWLS